MPKSHLYINLNLSPSAHFYFQDDTLKLITKGCKILLYLNISHTSLTDASLRAVAKLVIIVMQ